MTNRLIALALLSLTACGKSEKTPASKAADEPAKAEQPKTTEAPKTSEVVPAKAEVRAKPAGPAGTTCGGAGVVGGGDVPFCMRLPDGYKQEGAPAKHDSWTSVDYAKTDAPAQISVKWSSGTTGYEGLVEILVSEGNDKAHKLIASGETAAGAGKFVQYDRTPSSNGRHQIRFEAIIKGPNAIIKCHTSWWTDKPEGQLAADACKSLTPQ
jgi:hypothetical protein